MATQYKNPLDQANAMIYDNSDIRKAVTDKVRNLMDKGSLIRPGNHSYSGIDGMVEMTNPDKTRTRVTTESHTDFDDPSFTSVYNEHYPEDNSSIGWNDWPGKGTKTDEEKFYEIDEGRAPRHRKKYTDNLDYAKQALQKKLDRLDMRYRSRGEKQQIKPNPEFVNHVIEEASKVRGLGGRSIKPDQIKVFKDRNGYAVYIGDKYYKSVSFKRR